MVVSLNDIPTPEATAATAESPYFNSWTSVAEAFAAPANWLAASVTLKLSDLKALSAVEATSAASVKLSSPAVAKLRAPVKPPFKIEAVSTPALLNSAIASAASLAENAVSAPAFMAASLNCFIVSELAPVRALMLLIFSSNSAAFEIEPPTAALNPWKTANAAPRAVTVIVVLVILFPSSPIFELIPFNALVALLDKLEKP